MESLVVLVAFSFTLRGFSALYNINPIDPAQVGLSALYCQYSVQICRYIRY